MAAQSKKFVEKSALMFLLASLTLSLGCAKDKSLDDFKREKVEQELAKLQPAAGTYRGVVYSKTDRSVLGTLQMTLTAQTQVSSGMNGSKADEKPVLAGQLEFQGDRKMATVVKDSYYDPETKRYQANVPIGKGDGAGSAEQLTLAGHIEKGVFEGTIEAFGYADFGGTFTLSKDGEIPAQVAGLIQQSQEAGSESYTLKTFLGNTRFFSGTAKPLKLIVLEPRQSSEEDLLSVFVPVKTVQVTLNYGQSLQVLHSNARWDRRTGVLTGQSSLHRGSSSVALSLDCRQQITTQGEAGWTCQHFTNALGLVATTEVTQVRNSSEDPVDSTNQDAMSESYLGTLTFNGQEQARGAVFTVLYPLKSRALQLAELFSPESSDPVTANLRFSDTYSVPISNAVLDYKSGHLTGSYELAGDNGRNQIGLDCKRPAAHQPGWNCKHFIGGSGQVATSDFTLSSEQEVAGAIKSFRDVRGAEDIKFTGMSDFGGEKIPVSLSAHYPALSRAQDLLELLVPSSEKFLKITLVFGTPAKATAPVFFDKVRWDERAGTLEGSGTALSGGKTDITLRCKKFYFTQTKPPFTCDYVSSLNGKMATLILESY
jgi:hypothetical protein